MRKLNDEQIKVICLRYKTTKDTLKIIAADYKICQQTVLDYLNQNGVYVNNTIKRLKNICDETVFE